MAFEGAQGLNYAAAAFLQEKKRQREQELAGVQEKGATERTGMQVAGQKDIAAMQYGQGGSVDRTNASHLQQVALPLEYANNFNPIGGMTWQEGDTEKSGKYVPNQTAQNKALLAEVSGKNAATQGVMQTNQFNRESMPLATQLLKQDVVKGSIANDQARFAFGQMTSSPSGSTGQSSLASPSAAQEPADDRGYFEKLNDRTNYSGTRFFDELIRGFAYPSAVLKDKYNKWFRAGSAVATPR